MSEKKLDIQESQTPEKELPSKEEVVESSISDSIEFKALRMRESSRTQFAQLKYRGQFCQALIGLLVLRSDSPNLMKATDFLLTLVNHKEVKDND